MKSEKIAVRLLGAALLLFPLTLTACAPTATSASSTPNSSRSALKIAAGQRASVSVKVGLDEVGVDDSQEKTLDIDFSNTDALGRVRGKENPVSWFSVTGVRAAPGGTGQTWTARIESAFLGYDIVKTQDNGSGVTTGVRYRPYVRLVLDISAPAQAPAGLTVLDVAVHNVNGQNGEVPVYADLQK